MTQGRFRSERAAPGSLDWEAGPDREGNLLVARHIRGALRILLLSLPLYAWVDHASHQAHLWQLHAAKAVLFASCAAILVALRRDQSLRWTRHLVLALLFAMAGVSAYSAVLAGHPVAHAMLSGMVAMAVGATVPWGWRGQLAAVSILGGSCVAVGWTVGSLPFGIDAYPTLVTLLALGATLPLAQVTAAARDALAMRERQLLEARDELERANHFKSDFVASMSHELRTPLNVIIGYHEILLERSLGDLGEEQVQVLMRADANARELLSLINTTLELSRLDSSRAVLVCGPVDIPALLDDLGRGMRALASRDGLEFRWHVAPETPVLRTDVVKLRMILNNLMHNALKFTEQGLVEVVARPVSRGVEFAVTDTGIGIPSDLQRLIFEPFRQAAPEIHGRYGGVGLGLHLVDRLTTQLGGQIELESEVGRGTRVTVTLPVVAEVAPA